MLELVLLEFDNINFMIFWNLQHLDFLDFLNFLNYIHYLFSFLF